MDKDITFYLYVAGIIVSLCALFYAGFPKLIWWLVSITDAL